MNPAQFEEFRYLGLALVDQNKYRSVKIGNRELIIPTDPNDPYLKSKIYLKGVRLETRDPI